MPCKNHLVILALKIILSHSAECNQGVCNATLATEPSLQGEIGQDVSSLLVIHRVKSNASTQATCKCNSPYSASDTSYTCTGIGSSSGSCGSNVCSIAKPVLQSKISSYCLARPSCSNTNDCSWLGHDCLPEYCRCDFGSTDCGNHLHCVTPGQNWVFTSGQRYCLHYTTAEKITDGILGAVAVAGVLIVAPELAPEAVDAAADDAAAAATEDAAGDTTGETVDNAAEDSGDDPDGDGNDDKDDDSTKTECKKKFPNVLPTLMGLSVLLPTLDGLASSNASVITDVKQCADSFVCGFVGGAAFEGFGGLITSAVCQSLVSKNSKLSANITVQRIQAKAKQALPCVVKHQKNWSGKCVTTCLKRKEHRPNFVFKNLFKDAKACMKKCTDMNERMSANPAYISSTYTKCGYPDLGKQMSEAYQHLGTAGGQDGVCNMLGMVLGQKVMANLAKKAVTKDVTKIADETEEEISDGSEEGTEAESEVDKDALACT